MGALNFVKDWYWEHNYQERTEIVDEIVERALITGMTKNTAFEKCFSYGSALRHAIQNQSTTSSGLTAYHITNQDLEALKFLRGREEADECYVDDTFSYTNDLESFEFISADIDTTNHQISANNRVYGNVYETDNDTYGATFGVPSSKSYFYYLVDQQQYLIIKISYWSI